MPTQSELEELSKDTQNVIKKRSEISVQEMPITWKMIEIMAGGASLPVRYHGNPGDVLTVMKMGQELGVPPLESLNEIYVVNGKPAASGKLLAAMVWRAGHVIICDPSPTGAVVTTYRKINGKYHAMPVVTFTEEDAKRAGLWDKETYQSYPAAMMAWRAITLACRIHFPDVVSSIGYTPEEQGLEDLPMIEATMNVVEILGAEEVYEGDLPE